MYRCHEQNVYCSGTYRRGQVILSQTKTTRLDKTEYYFNLRYQQESRTP